MSNTMSFKQGFENPIQTRVETPREYIQSQWIVDVAILLIGVVAVVLALLYLRRLRLRTLAKLR